MAGCTRVWCMRCIFDDLQVTCRFVIWYPIFHTRVKGLTILLHWAGRQQVRCIRMICSHLRRMISSHWRICHLTPYFSAERLISYIHTCAVCGWFAVTYGFVIRFPIHHKYIGWGVYLYGVFRWCVRRCNAAPKDFSSDTLLYTYIKNTLKVERTHVCGMLG